MCERGSSGVSLTGQGRIIEIIGHDTTYTAMLSKPELSSTVELINNI